jgi:hypothetical protein
MGTRHTMNEIRIATGCAPICAGSLHLRHEVDVYHYVYGQRQQRQHQHDGARDDGDAAKSLRRGTGSVCDRPALHGLGIPRFMQVDTPDWTKR